MDAERKRPGAPGAHGQPLEPPARGGGVLVIDDDPGIVDVLVMALRDDEGFAVRTAYSVTQALSSAAGEPPALIVLDATLPGEEVHEAVARLRARAGWECACIVLCSGRNDIASLACALGATCYLRKPFDVDELIALAEHYATRLSLA
jgi:two-component system KDP operon response regulator KdpE